MKPENVNPSNFVVEQIIYKEDSFSIAVGIFGEDEVRRFAMRWDGESDDDLGYPQTYGKAMWFQLPDDLSGVISTLVAHSHIQPKELG